MQIIWLEDISKNEKISLSSLFHLLFPKYKQRYDEFINSTSKKEKLKRLIKIIKPKKIEEGDLLFYSTIFEDLRIWIARKEDISKFIEKKNLNISKIEFLNNSIDSKYLLGYFDQKEIKEYLSLNFTGCCLKHISPQSIFNLYIPLNSKKIKYGVSSIEITDINAHKDIQDLLIEEYKKAKKSELEISKLVLMGAIAENILIQELLKNDVKIGHIKQYQGLGKLIELSNIEEIFDKKNLLENFKTLNQARNLLHPKKHLENIENKENIIEKANMSFKTIINEFNMEL